MKPAAKKEARKTRPIRCTDAEWADFLLVGSARVRVVVSKEAARLRRMKPNDLGNRLAATGDREGEKG